MINHTVYINDKFNILYFISGTDMCMLVTRVEVLAEVLSKHRNSSTVCLHILASAFQVEFTQI